MLGNCDKIECECVLLAVIAFAFVFAFAIVIVIVIVFASVFVEFQVNPDSCASKVKPEYTSLQFSSKQQIFKICLQLPDFD